MDRDDRHHDRDALLQAVICGDLPEDAEAVQQALRQDPALGDRLRRLRALAGRLDRLGQVDRNSLASSLSEPSPPDHEAIVADALARHRQSRRRNLQLYVLAAAAVVVVLVLVRLLSNGGGVDLEDLKLGPGEMTPVGPVESYDTTYRWNLERPRRGHFEVFFYNDSDPEPRRALFHASVLEPSSQWQPNEDQLRLLAPLPRVIWEVQAQPLEGPPVVRSAEIWLR